MSHQTISISLANLPSLASGSPDSVSFPSTDDKSPTKLSPLNVEFTSSTHNRTRLWERIEDPFWAAVPIAAHLIAIATLVAAIWQTSQSYLTIYEVDGTGQLDFGILGSCAVAPGTTRRICTPRTAVADFLPSLLLVAPTIPGFSLFQLPTLSAQTPAVFFSSLAFLLLSLIIFIPVWITVYFPQVGKNTKSGQFIKRRAKEIYFLAGVLGFISFTLTVTIGIGYLELMQGAAENFVNSSEFELQRGTEGSVWIPRIGDAFGLVWAASAFTALIPLGVNIALHNRLDERAARGGKRVTNDW